MSILRAITPKLLVLSVALSLVVACGEDDGSIQSGEQSELQNADRDECTLEGEEDWHKDAEKVELMGCCPDGTTLNPISGICVDETGETTNQDDDNSEDQCGPGQTYHPGLEECIDEEGDDPEDESDCEHHEMWDEEAGECVPDPEECGPGALEGQTCRPNQGVLPNAQVQLDGFDCNQQPFTETTTADGEGFYEFNDVPAGAHELTITSGSFEVTEEVKIFQGETTDRTSEAAKICLESSSVEIAVIDGTFDHVPGLLNPLGIEHDVINGSSAAAEFFGDLDDMQQYDIIFAECAAPWDSMSYNSYGVDMEDIKNNIRAFVESGNSLYASDWAHSYVNQTFPEVADFYDEDGTGPRVGASETVDADVTSTLMEDLLGTPTAEIVFELGAWAVMTGVGPTTEPHFRADVTASGETLENAPVLVTYDDPIGGGRVLYSSFHNEDQASDQMLEILEFMIFQL